MPTKKTAAAKTAAKKTPKVKTPEVKTPEVKTPEVKTPKVALRPLKYLKVKNVGHAQDIISKLFQCQEPEELAAYVSTNFGEISLEAAELFFHFINK